MHIAKLITFAVFLVWIGFLNNSFAETGFDCNGFSTVIYTDNNTAVAVCHSLHMKIKRTLLAQWQDCTDATIYIRNKKTNKSKMHADCIPITHKQFKVNRNNLLIKHYHNEHPGFELKPLLIENYNIINKSKTYTLIAKLKKYTKEEILRTISILDEELKKPFNGSTYFKNVYNGFFMLRNYALTEPQFALKKLNEYNNNDIFSGEVSEVLSDVVREAQLISYIKQQ